MSDMVKRLRESGSRSEVELHEDRDEAADRIEELESQLAAMTAERKAAIPRAYAMGVDDASKAVKGATICDGPAWQEDRPSVWLATLCACENVVRALTPPADLVERVLKTKEPHQ